MPKATLTSGLRLHYQQVGEGPDLVMVHGLTGNLAVWHLRIVPELAERFRVLTYDLRGHGHSDTPRVRLHARRRWPTTCWNCSTRSRSSGRVIVGHSYGADIALYHALRHPRAASAR